MNTALYTIEHHFSKGTRLGHTFSHDCPCKPQIVPADSLEQNLTMYLHNALPQTVKKSLEEQVAELKEGLDIISDVVMYHTREISALENGVSAAAQKVQSSKDKIRKELTEDIDRKRQQQNGETK